LIDNRRRSDEAPLQAWGLENASHLCYGE